MPMPSMILENIAIPPNMVVSPSSSKIVPNTNPDLDLTGVSQVLPLDQLRVVEGVYRREQIRSSNDLVLDDEFQFPSLKEKFQASCSSEANGASMEVSTDSRFGPSSFCATATHSVIFMTDTGQYLRGFLLDGSKNAADRPSLILNGKINSTSNYILIEITKGLKEFDWLG